MTAPASAPVLRIFAGTTEGRLLCEWASGAGIPARAYAATEYGGELLGELPGIEVHAGRLDEADMERELSGARIVVDATHPFATLASGNIRAASLAVGARCLRLARPAEALPKGVVSVASIACAARFLSENPGRALLTTGSKELAPYTRVADFAERFFVRVLPLPGAITKCIDAGFSPSHVIGMQGPFTRELNEALVSRFVVLDMPVISDVDLQKLLRRTFPDLTPRWAEQFALLFHDLRQKCNSGEISTKTLDLRGLLAALRLIREGIPTGQALKLGIINKAFEPFERQLAADTVWARIPQDAGRSQLFGV